MTLAILRGTRHPLRGAATPTATTLIPAFAKAALVPDQRGCPSGPAGLGLEYLQLRYAYAGSAGVPKQAGLKRCRRHANRC